ncbi:hypothetical protein AVEN_216199-1 [Araneus ventricosus]|uniref:Uncharacterized protein n=1 Tax=Araneus ventricosus TaxID=182803 RepID=A0A4Y2GN75_ARAVE|nr:hypothetical protein AVEN_191609-1 [Araneus ventricosus]GBM55442.1 hypothetical protein AVEN_48068-1 [Araneus ventricosus]GBM55597.1 hypothetical protein AVEN_173023-1 [Araneus ventricosus]GBM55648.1 hypothetical protein AVEN_216199-1 [Araneus ventricosus]
MLSRKRENHPLGRGYYWESVWGEGPILKAGGGAYRSDRRFGATMNDPPRWTGWKLKGLMRSAQNWICQSLHESLALVINSLVRHTVAEKEYCSSGKIASPTIIFNKYIYLL